MKVSYEALQVFIFLMPGLLASALLSIFLVREKQDGFAVVVESLVYSLIIYAISSPLVEEMPAKLEPVRLGKEIVSYKLLWLPVPLFVTLGLAVVLPIVVAISANRDFHMRLLRWVGATIFGWPEYSSRDAEEGLLYLQDPAWITENETYQDMEVDSLFLSKEREP